MRRLIGVSVAVMAAVAIVSSAGAANVVSQLGSNGKDYSTNAPSLSGLTLLKTMQANADRLGYGIQAQCVAGLTVVFDDGSGQGQSIWLVAGSGADGQQGGSIDWAAMPHTGRILIYSSNASCQYAARDWEP